MGKRKPIQIAEKERHMEEKNAKLQRFFTACDDLITGKYILADTKIGELLRSVATST